MRYGRATWVDALGRRTPVSTRWDGAAIELTVPAAVVEAARYPAVLDPQVSGEIALDQPVTIPAPGNPGQPSLAWNGSEYLLAFSASGDLFGARLTSAGALLDPAGFIISAQPNTQQWPDVASDGAGFFVVWQDQRTSPSGEVYGARVSAAGLTLDPGGLQLGNTASRQPKVAFAGGRYLVVWSDDADVYGARFDPTGATGTLLDAPAGFLLQAKAGVTEGSPDVDADGTGFFVTWSDSRAGAAGLYGANVSTAAAVTPVYGLLIASGSANEAALAWNGASHLVVWSSVRGSPSYSQIVAALVSPAGTVWPDTTGGLALTTSFLNKSQPAVTSIGTSGSGTTFLVGWAEAPATGTDPSDVYGVRVSAAGVPLDVPRLALTSGTSTQREPALANNGVSALVAWTDTAATTTASRVLGETVSATGTVGATALLTRVASTEVAPAVAWGATNYLVVWQDNRTAANGWDIYGARLSATGTVLDPAGIPISTALDQQTSPDVAYLAGSDQFLVVWADNRNSAATDIFGARVTSQGTVLDPSAIAISTGDFEQADPAVAADGTRALVTWTDNRNKVANQTDIFGTFVSAAGIVSPDALTGLPIAQTPSAQYEPDVAWNGAEYLVAWSDARNTSLDVYATRISGAGVVLKPAGDPVADQPPSTDQSAPAVAAVGSTFFVAWQDSRAVAASATDIYGTRVVASGNTVFAQD